MEGDICGVRILPSLIEFKDTEVKNIYKVNVTVKNISKTSKEIRYYGPQSKVFRLKVKNPEKPVAPGLEVGAVIEYEATGRIETDRVVVTVDGEVIEVPLHGFPSLPALQLDQLVNFGTVVANSQVITRDIQVQNRGSKEGEFKIKYTGNKPIGVYPSSGKVPPNSSRDIRVEYVTKKPGKFDEVAKVKLEGQEASLLRITGEVVESCLELLSYSREEPVRCIQFGASYYGTDKTDSAVLFNNSPEPICFVAILDESAIGQEVGIDLTKSTTASLAGKRDGICSDDGKVNELTSLVTVLPNQGLLAPYEKVPIFFRFSPRWSTGKQGFNTTQKAAPRKDFALFLQIKVVGSSQGFSTDDNQSKHTNAEGCALEVPLAGTALPVLLGVAPQPRFDFGESPVGDHVDVLCTLNNDSHCMQVDYNFRRVAHFTAHPSIGAINPGQTQDVIISFAPKQVGQFKITQYVDVIGPVADKRNPFLMHKEVIYSLPVSLSGSSDPVTIKKEPVFNPGITPKITNEVGLYVDTTVSSPGKNPRNAFLSSKGTKLHTIKSAKDAANENKTFVAFPNDRARSIRPTKRDEKYCTVFTGAQRHHYVDPDYAYTDEEADAVKQHKEFYVDYVEELREERRNKMRTKEYKQTNNKADMGIKPAAGLKPKKLKAEEVGVDPRPPTPPNAAFQLLSTKTLASAELRSSLQEKDGLNAIPTTAQEKEDCKRILSPQELHQIIIGPPTIDFGPICLKSVSEKELKIVNNLKHSIHLVVNVDCRELRQSCPLSQVVPGCSKASLPLIFESNTRGSFQRSLDYTVNGYYRNHVTVFAKVVPVALELSQQELTLEPQIGLPADAGIRGVITLYNKLNYPAEFTWSPILGERGTAFSIRPATGVVEPFKDLDCEVVFHPSYLAPDDGLFGLQVHGGVSHKLKCVAKLGGSNIQFIDRRIMFGQVPLHLTTTRTALLKNNSLNHAYFQVLDPNPFPGLTVSPVYGVIAVGGTAEVKVHLTPNAVMKFDTRVNVAIRGGKTLELRMGGTVETPCVDIELSSFNLGGVYCGSSSTTNFKLINKAHTKARVEFDLSRYKDFSLNFPSKQATGECEENVPRQNDSTTTEEATYQSDTPGTHCVCLQADEAITCELIFKPTEVASYDFVMPVTINQTGAPSPSPTPFPPTPIASHKNSLQHIINPRPVQVAIATPRKKVVATALRQPLLLSQYRVEFSLSPGVYEMTSASGIGRSKEVSFINKTDKKLKWVIDISKGNQILEENVFRFLHSSGMPYMVYDDQGVEGILDPGQTQKVGIVFSPETSGHYEVRLPIVINDAFQKPYQFLTLVGELKGPALWFDPLAVVFTPMPLDTDISTDFQIFAANYTKKSVVSVELPEIECGNGDKVKPLSVTFPEGQDIEPCCGDEGQKEPCVISCKVTFKCNVPVSFCEPIIFLDDIGQSFTLPVTAIADNCLLTSYPFLAQHRTDHQIVCEQGASLRGRRTASRESAVVGEAVLVPCSTPPRCSSRPSTTATSSNFEVSTSSYEDSSQSVTESNYPSTPRDGALNKFACESEQNSRSRNDLQSRSLGSAIFPEEDTEEGIFYSEVLVAAQRWFSSQGWPGGPNPITVPDSLRSGLTKKPTEEKAKNAKGGTWESNNLKKEFRTVYDMVAHLAGRQVPGIPINSPLPEDPVERCKQVYWQHTTLLSFLKTQGACVASIKPEYLMELRDYRNWMRLQMQLEERKYKSGRREIKMKVEEDADSIDEDLFEAVSKRAWVDLLLQLLKTLYLARITPRQFKNMPTPYRTNSLPNVDQDPLCSNIYSISERIVLLWLNHNYEQQRHVVWRDSVKGGVPPSRWVVNFDFDLLDGLVIACALSAHVPFLVKSHLADMYTQPGTAEQCLHNALKVVNAMRAIGLDYDIQAIDITDPNPISLLLLTIHLYQNLPQYLPKDTVEFVGGLHTTIHRQVRLNNPSLKALTYHAMIAGHDARDFTLPKGDTITIAPKSTASIPVEMRSRFLRPSEGVLVFVGRRQGSNVGSTLVFSLSSQINNITPKTTVKCESACYQLTHVEVDVKNPFSETGEFRIVLIEPTGDLPADDDTARLIQTSKKTPKKVRSRIDHGQKKSVTVVEEETAKTAASQELEKKTEEGTVLRSFHCSARTVKLEGNGTAPVQIEFLPFQTGLRECSIIFISEAVGEFLYQIEGNATLPLPSTTPFKPSPHSVRISSAAAAGGGRGVYGGDDKVVYWKCEVGRVLKETLPIPLNNATRDRALVLAAQQDMSEQEIQRRGATGTLTSGPLTANVLQKLSSTPGNHTATKKPKSEGTTYNVQCDSTHFTAPSTLYLPHAVRNDQATSNDGAAVDLPVKFSTKEAGHYPCKVVLTSTDDVRVYVIECTVVPEGAEAQLEFTSPVHQSLTQDIPIVNQTNHDWKLEATIQGTGFVGPQTMLAKAYQTNHYPLLFRPQFEGPVQGKLLLRNTVDNVEHVFHLVGNGERPLPLDHISLDCQAKQSLKKILEIPNATKRKLHYKAESDLSIVSGPETITVLPGKTAQYELTVSPLKRGSYSGVLAFVAGDNPLVSVDSDGEEVNDGDEEEATKGYRVWYSVDIHVDPPPPERTLKVKCICQKRAALEVGVTNPTPNEITLKAEISGPGLSGPSEVTLPPQARGLYDLVYAPPAVGTYKGSLILFHESVGEFWYDLDLEATRPPPTTLPHLECELGRWVRQTITLSNPSEETLQLIPTVSNTNNFVLERDSEQPIELRPHSTLRLPLTFMPSTLGTLDQEAKITFHSEQLGEWEFMASGTGLLPQPQEPVSITAAAGSSSTLIIPFRNPLDVSILVQIHLKDKDLDTRRASDATENPISPFCLLLKHEAGIRLGPKSTLDIPISFAPEDMRMFEALCKVVVQREDGKTWKYAIPQESGSTSMSSLVDELHEITWFYPIHGYPELTTTKAVPPTIIECQARERIEERLEVTLSGVAPSAGGPKRPVRARAVTPVKEPAKDSDGVVVSEVIAVAEEFTHEIVYGNSDVKANLDPAVALSLVRKHRDPNTGLVVLLFNVVYAPYVTMQHEVQLLVKGATGGFWRFPLLFVATEPEADDVIVIEAVGLQKESFVGFRLNSQASHPVPFNAYLVAGSDKEFSVSPQSGELLPSTTKGTLIKIGFIPPKYGKTYRGRLVVQAPEMQWTYNVKGMLPEYVVPRGYSSRPMAGPHPDPRKRDENVNFVKSNLKLSTSAVSSPLKGAPVVTRQRPPMMNVSG